MVVFGCEILFDQKYFLNLMWKFLVFYSHNYKQQIKKFNVKHY